MKPCSIENCLRAAKARGWCNTHYEAWRKCGDPTGLKKDRRGQEYLARIIENPTGEGCLAWPFGIDKSGYGQMWSEGRTRQVSRVVCEKVHGDPPTPRHQAAHSCGKGHEACVAPWHLSWKTPTENSADKVGHGTLIFGERQWLSKLTKEDVREIRSLAGKITGRELAKRFGVAATNISQIQKRHSWKQVA